MAIGWYGQLEDISYLKNKRWKELLAMGEKQSVYKWDPCTAYWIITKN